MIRTENLVKKYKRREVVSHVNLRVQKGEVVGLLGPNGAGKTTTFYMIVGVVRPDDGQIYYDGDDITYLPMYKRARLGIGYLPQEPSVFRKLSVEENILLVLEAQGKPLKERKSRTEALLQEFRIHDVRKQMGFSLSGGERRRVEIARALAAEPQFLLLDEPFTGIDPIAVSDIQKTIEYLKEKGLGILITDHNVQATLKIVDRAYILHEGKILVEGPAKEVAESAEARKFYLGEEFKL